MQNKTLTERVFHAVCFEGIALIITAPLFAWLMGRTVFQMGMLAIVLSTTAMLWNMIYNAIFDRLWPSNRVKRTAKVRIFHALGFEGGFILIGLTLVMITLGVSVKTAFIMEIGFFIFFLPYTYIYNLAYDSLRERFMKRRAKKVAMAFAENHDK
ncbi:multidrug/biocide efflux PACE transporter [Pragia fontium]|uniref:Uncharacterized membrane protein n=1 Tax=Pragia fontium DSM 5563 = ATCC 49100 TaxID=1122977 RepID=A0AAJ5BG08_9GAMM|nr:multidrug/biocide efflux PACE transporter [Pragia fontium]SFC12464.1 Uncharacterized membrane protein [Pragia fontium DSM 5563 = ATCC 49100]SUB81352.1 Predicted membrane protein [Pragia fontium]VEJ53557.1 Predicted membrane protein [Pragia fontium]